MHASPNLTEMHERTELRPLGQSRHGSNVTVAAQMPFLPHGYFESSKCFGTS